MQFNLIKISRYIFYLFLFILPWQVRWIFHTAQLNGVFWEYGSFALYASQLVLLAALVLLLILYFKQPKQTKSLTLKWVDVVILGILFFAALSIIWSIDWQISWQRWLVLVDAVVVFYLVRGLSIKIKHVAAVFAAAGIIQSVLAIYQFITQSVFASKYLGMASQLVTDQGVVVVEGVGRWLRAYGSMPHPNILGGFLAICLFFIIGLIFDYAVNYYQRAQLSSKVIAWTVFLFAGLAIMTYGLLLTFSRSAWLSFIIGWLLIWIVLLVKHKKILLNMNLKIGVVMLLVTIVFCIGYGDLIMNRFQADSRLEVKSLTERQTGAATAVELLKQKPIFGYGLGNYTTALYQQDGDLPGYEYQPVHNADLLIAVELGIVGWLLVNVLIFYLLVRMILRIRHTQQTQELIWWLTVLPAFVLIMLVGFLDHYVWSLYFGIILTVFIWGLTTRQLENAK